jgi:hypothetical protein
LMVNSKTMSAAASNTMSAVASKTMLADLKVMIVNSKILCVELKDHDA